MTGWVYSAVRGITTLVGKSADTALRALTPLLESTEAQPAESHQRAAVVAALNGVLGDRLAASGNDAALETKRFEQVAAAAEHWDGSDPIRTIAT